MGDRCSSFNADVFLLSTHSRTTGGAILDPSTCPNVSINTNIVIPATRPRKHIRPHSVYFTVNGSRQAYFCLVRGKKNSLLAHVGKNGSILSNLNSFIYWSYKKSLFFLGMSEEKIKIKAGRLLFFLVWDIFYMSEDSLTEKYSESGLIAEIWPDNSAGLVKGALGRSGSKSG